MTPVHVALSATFLGEAEKLNTGQIITGCIEKYMMLAVFPTLSSFEAFYSQEPVNRIQLNRTSSSKSDSF